MTQIELMKKYGISVRGHLGQHLLVDENIAKKIVSLLACEKKDRVLEIGPGLGALTSMLLENPIRLSVIEKDPKFAAVLREEFGSGRGLEVIEKDFLDFDLEAWIKKTDTKDSKLKVISNLPYYITAPILFQIIKCRAWIQEAVFMMQKEVADRLLAKPGTKEYGRLTLAVQFAADIQPGFKVPPGCFTPRPEVDSYVVRLVFKSSSVPVPQADFFEALIKTAFQQRRKTLLPLVAALVKTRHSRERVEDVFEALGLARDVRGERLSLEQYMKLTRELF